MLDNKAVTISDLAKCLGVSATTISRALNNHPAISEKTKRENSLVGERNGVSAK